METTKITSKKESKKVVNASAKETTKKAKVKSLKETPKVQEKKVIKEVENQQQASLVEAVIAHREVIYRYPEDVIDTLDRKKWRQKVRNKLGKLEKIYLRIKDRNSEEYKEAYKAYMDYKSQVMKPEAKMA